MSLQSVRLARSRVSGLGLTVCDRSRGSSAEVGDQGKVEEEGVLRLRRDWAAAPVRAEKEREERPKLFRWDFQ